MIRRTAWWTLGMLALASAPVAADEAGASGEDATPGAEPKLLEPSRPAGRPSSRAAAASPAFSHRRQLQISVRAGVGLRAIVPYDDGSYCGATDASTTSGNAPVCTGRAPFSFDLELGYGLTDRIDAVVETRIGLETDFAATAFTMGGPRMFHLAPGARFFFSDSKSTKLFTTAQLVLDFAGYEDAGGKGRGTDFGVRNLNGLWFDVDRAYGFYGYVGETATFGRWMRFELEVGAGFQGRY